MKKRIWIGMLGILLFALGTYVFHAQMRRGVKFVIRKLTNGGGSSSSCPGCAREFTDGVSVHERAYRKNGLRPQRELKDLDELSRKGILARIDQSDRFQVSDMEHSRPYVLPVVLRFLDVLSSEYRSILKSKGLGYRPFVIVSATRSIESAEVLTEENPIARSRSHHLNGKTIDISYKKFDGFEGHKLCLIEAISKMRREGRCYVKFESMGSLHLTVR